ncbi:hypothetical protein CerSpe_064160 [Prunus speciosa]
MAGLIQTHCKHTNLEPIGKWKNLEVLSLDLSKGSVHGREALSIVKLVPNIKYLNLKGAKVNRDGLVTLLRGCKELVMLDARDWSEETSDEMLNDLRDAFNDLGDEE